MNTMNTSNHHGTTCQPVHKGAFLTVDRLLTAGCDLRDVRSAKSRRRLREAIETHRLSSSNTDLPPATGPATPSQLLPLSPQPTSASTTVPASPSPSLLPLPFTSAVTPSPQQKLKVSVRGLKTRMHRRGSTVLSPPYHRTSDSPAAYNKNAVHVSHSKGTPSTSLIQMMSMTCAPPVRNPVHSSPSPPSWPQHKSLLGHGASKSSRRRGSLALPQQQACKKRKLTTTAHVSRSPPSDMDASNALHAIIGQPPLGMYNANEDLLQVISDIVDDTDDLLQTAPVMATQR